MPNGHKRIAVAMTEQMDVALDALLDTADLLWQERGTDDKLAILNAMRGRLADLSDALEDDAWNVASETMLLEESLPE